MSDLNFVDIICPVHTSLTDISESFKPLPFLKSLNSIVRQSAKPPGSNTLLNYWLERAAEPSNIEQASTFIDLAKQNTGYRKFAISGGAVVTAPLASKSIETFKPYAWYTMSLDVFTQNKNNHLTGKILLSVYEHVFNPDQLVALQLKPNEILTLAQVIESPKVLSTKNNLVIPEVNTFFRYVVENSSALTDIAFPGHTGQDYSNVVCISPSASWVGVVTPPQSKTDDGTYLNNALYTPIGWVKMRNIGFAKTLNAIYTEDWKTLLKLTGIRIQTSGIKGPETNGIFDWSTPKAKLILAELTRMSIKNVNDISDRNSI